VVFYASLMLSFKVLTVIQEVMHSPYDPSAASALTETQISEILHTLRVHIDTLRQTSGRSERRSILQNRR